MTGIFLSYRNIRRSYAPMFADWVLRRRFGDANVFEAGRSNLPGVPFPDSIRGWLARCSLIVVFIDPPWIAELELLRDPKDWVRQEIQYGIDHGKTILPILLDGADMPERASLPAEIAPMTRPIALHMSPRTAHTDLLRLIGEIERLAPDLVLAALTDPDWPAPTATAAMIRPEYEVMPFRPRPELDQLAAWCRHREDPPARLLCGASGAGKTRLALRLCAELRAAGWAAGLASTSADPQALDRLREIDVPCLVVIDDAETRPDAVAAALRALAATTNPAARLLLTARTHGEWLEALRDDPDDRVIALLGQLAPIELAPLAPADGDFLAARAAIGERLGSAIPPPRGGAPTAETLLELQVAALVDLLPAAAPDANPWRRLADLERDQWSRTAGHLGLSFLRRDQLTEIMSMVTMFGAATESQAEALLSALRAFTGRPMSEVDAAVALVRAMLPGRRPLNPLEPLPLADEVVTGLLTSGYQLSRVIHVVDDDQIRVALVVLGRCLAARPELSQPVDDFLGAAPTRLLPLAMTILPVIPRPEPLVARMRAALERVPAADLDALENTLPQRSRALAAFAVELTERALAARGGLVADLATARLSGRLATRLAYLGGHPTEAITSARVAVAHLRDTATSEGEQAELAEAYAALARALDLDPGAVDEALHAGDQAIRGYRRLPAEGRYAGALANTLIDQVARSISARRPDGVRDLAAEAYRLTGALCEARPARYRSLYADATDNLAILDRDSSLAERAVELRRELARARPDAYRPELAAALFNLGLLYAQDGRADARALWEESAAIYAELAAAEPGRFDRELAGVRQMLAGLDG